MKASGNGQRNAWALTSWATIGAIVAVGVAFAPRSGIAHDHSHHAHAAAAQAPAGYKRSVASYQAPDVKLADANGKPVSLRASLAGKDPVMLNFIFTTCTAICPVMSATFAQVQEQLGPERDRVRMISISIDPEHDTPAKLKEYAKRYGAGAQWRMLTGRVEDSLAVQRAFDIYRGDKMNHEPATFLRAGEGQSWVRLDGFASAAEVMREYRALAGKQ